MTALNVAALMLGTALAATGAWAQDPPIVPPSNTTETWPSPPGWAFPVGRAVTLPDGVQVSAGRIELSPDQKLARAYALCERYRVFYSVAGCDEIAQKWMGSPVKNSADGASDLALIEEVARGLK